MISPSPVFSDSPAFQRLHTQATSPPTVFDTDNLRVKHVLVRQQDLAEALAWLLAHESDSEACHVPEHGVSSPVTG